VNTLEFIRKMNALDAELIQRVAAALPALAAAVDAAAARVESGGRILYVGAGTSGRLGVLDASEIPPTFGTEPDRVAALVAGGREAMFEAREGAEDDTAAAVADLARSGVGGADVVVGIAASGSTPYVLSAIERAKALGCLTICMVCKRGTALETMVTFPVVVDAGAEVVAGSTRLKAGTAQKLMLNMFSTAIMARLGLVYRGEMVAMRPTNSKLRTRAVRIVRDLLGLDAARAEELLHRTHWHLPAALVAGKWSLDDAGARAHIHSKRGHVARALEESPEPEGH
jgi:N-acetylmuramic acid 6-phosphate etherase